MKDPRITDPLFREAVDAIDNGNMASLEMLVEEYPRLLTERLDNSEEGYFGKPYLLWFVAGNPIRNERLPTNIIGIARYLVNGVKKHAPDSSSFQFDYTLGLVSTGRLAKESGIQISMMDLLIDAGAKPQGALSAIAHGNNDAAIHLISRGEPLTLATAICLDRSDEIETLINTADSATMETALVAASFCGKSISIEQLLKDGVNPNTFPKASTGFHSHATALHQAVFAGSIECVELLVKAGANPDLKDTIYGGTPLGWAMHMQSLEECTPEMKKKYEEIANFLKNRTAENTDV